jgi:membrane dipeptidase
MNDWNISEEAAALHRDALVWDMTTVWKLAAPTAAKLELLSRAVNSGFDLVSLALSSEWDGREDPLPMLAQERALLEEHADKFVLIDSADDVIEAKHEGKLAVCFHFKSCPSRIDVAMVEDCFRLGVHHCIFFNLGAEEGDNHVQRDGGGLSPFGGELVEAMNRVGMIVDATHAKYATSMDILGLSKDPVIFSHSNAAALWNHPRNLRDDQIKACAKSGGVIGVAGTGTYIGENDNSAEGLVRHIDYMAELVGPEHIGLGLDYVPTFGMANAPAAAGFKTVGHDEGYRQASGGKSEAPRREDIKYVEPEGVPPLTEALIAGGYSEAEIRGILGENWLRVARQVWK